MERNTASQQAEDASRLLLRISHVAQETGISDSTLRTWERRYGVGPTARTEGAHRLYTPEDVMRLRAMGSLITRGISASQAASEVRIAPIDRLTRIVESANESMSATFDAHGCGTSCCSNRDASGAHHEVQERPTELLLQHCDDFNPVATTELIAQLLTEHGPAVTWERFVVPALKHLRLTHAKTGRGLEVERFAMEHLQRAFTHCAASHATAQNAIMLTSTATEPHTLPLYAIQATLSAEGIGAVTLAALPFESAEHAARRCAAAGVLVFAQQPVTSHATARWAQLAGRHRVILAGCGWHYDSVPASCAHVGDFRSVLRELRAVARSN